MSMDLYLRWLESMSDQELEEEFCLRLPDAPLNAWSLVDVIMAVGQQRNWPVRSRMAASVRQSGRQIRRSVRQ